MKTNNIILKPILTELSMKDAKSGWFTFSVNVNGRKPQIKRAIEANFNVNIIDLKTNIIKNRSRRFGKLRKKTLISPWKKVRVKLATGQKIQFFEGLEDGKKA